MLEKVLFALLVLHPGQDCSQFIKYAYVITKESERNKIDPFLVVALIHLESGGDPGATSGRGDFGLMQIRAKAHPKYKYDYRPLLDPVVNIAAGVEMLAYWRRYHNTKCRDDNHYWWAHYQYGRQVMSNSLAEKVHRVRNRVNRLATKRMSCRLAAAHRVRKARFRKRGLELLPDGRVWGKRRRQESPVDCWTYLPARLVSLGSRLPILTPACDMGKLAVHVNLCR